MSWIETIEPYVEELIFAIDVDAKRTGARFAFHLDYETKTYRQKALAGLIRDSVEYFALTHKEFEEFRQRGDFLAARRKAWGRISTARKDKKGDYGELLLFLLLYFRLGERPERFVTKVRLRSSRGDQINNNHQRIRVGDASARQKRFELLFFRRDSCLWKNQFA